MSATKPQTIAVIGGGITGLAAAWTLSREAPTGTRIVLIEAEERLGGKIRTDAFDGGYVEAGADSFLARDSWTVDLCRQLGLGDELVPPRVFGAALWLNQELRKLPPGLLFGLPTRPAACLSAPLTWAGRARALGELVLPGPLSGNDVSVGAFVAKRFGSEVLDRLVDPLLAGTRAGRPDEMSLAAALPQIDAVARSHRSVMKGLRRQSQEGVLVDGPPPFLAVRGGMERMVDALRRELKKKIEVMVGLPVETVRRNEGGYELVGREPLQANSVIITSPAFDAARLLQDLSPPAGRLLAGIEYTPSLSVTLTFPKGRIAVPQGTSGVLVPSGSGMTVSACTWWSVKWPNAAPDSFVIRCFIGRDSDDPSASLEDEELVATCASDVALLTGSQEVHEKSIVTRWSRGLPKYRIGHLDRVAGIERALMESPGIAVAGAAYRGSGIPDCIRQGHEAAQNILRTPIERGNAFP